MRRGPQRLDRIHRAAVAGEAHHRPVGIGEADADGSRQSPADAARGQRVIAVAVAMRAQRQRSAARRSVPRRPEWRCRASPRPAAASASPDRSAMRPFSSKFARPASARCAVQFFDASAAMPCLARVSSARRRRSSAPAPARAGSPGRRPSARSRRRNSWRYPSRPGRSARSAIPPATDRPRCRPTSAGDRRRARSAES